MPFLDDDGGPAWWRPGATGPSTARRLGWPLASWPPRPGGPQPTTRDRALQLLRAVNLTVLSIGLAVVLLHWVAPLPEVDAFTGFHHFAHRDLTVVDKTGDPAWHQATQHAARVWSQPSSGASVRLRWTTGRGPCRFTRGRIEVCLAEGDDLERSGLPSLQGLADQEVEDGHARAATVVVCGECRLEPSRRLQIATHEIGHTLGLEHSRVLGSVMYHMGGVRNPLESDLAALRARYAHDDAPPS